MLKQNEFKLYRIGAEVFMCK